MAIEICPAVSSILHRDKLQPRASNRSWLSDLDSNQDKSLQRALCYRYTIGQSAVKVISLRRRCKENCAQLTASSDVGGIAHLEKHRAGGLFAGLILNGEAESIGFGNPLGRG